MGTWTNHPTGNDRVQDMMCEVEATIIHHHHFLEEIKRQGYYDVCFDCVPKEIYAIVQKVADESLECESYEDEINRIIDKKGVEDTFSIVMEMIDGHISKLEKREPDAIVDVEDVEELVSTLIAITFVMLEYRVKFEDETYEFMRNNLIVVKEILKDSVTEDGKKYVDVIEMFLSKWENIISDYIENDNTYIVICGITIFDVLMIKDGILDIEQMKKDIPMFDLLGLQEQI